MTQVTLAITLPESLVKRAQAAGILADAEIAHLIEAELNRLTRVDRLFRTMDKLTQIQPPLSQAEIDDEIAGALAEPD